MAVRPGIVPCLIYNDAPAAIAFLCSAFGFERHLVVTGENPADVVHAQLTLNGCMIMLSTARQHAREVFGMVPPSETGGLVTGCIAVALDDPDAHHDRALALGAKILLPPHDNDYGGRGYEALDPEGNVWSFGSYDPWA